VGALGAREPGSFESNAGAAAENDDGLTSKRRFPARRESGAWTLDVERRILGRLVGCPSALSRDEGRRIPARPVMLRRRRLVLAAALPGSLQKPRQTRDLHDPPQPDHPPAEAHVKRSCLPMRRISDSPFSSAASLVCTE